MIAISCATTANVEVRYNNALAELNDCIGGLLHLGPNVIPFRTLLHLGPNVFYLGICYIQDCYHI